MQALSDKELVANFRQNVKGSAEEVYRRFFSRLARFCSWQLNSEPDGEDAAQEVMFKVIAKRKLDTFRGESSLWSWLRRIGINECCGLIRRQKKSRFHLRLDAGAGEGTLHEVLPSPTTGPEEQANSHETRQLLDSMVSRLRRPYQQAVQLNVYLDHSYKEGARQMGISVGAFAVYRHRAVRYLARLWHRHHRLAGFSVEPKLREQAA